MSTTEQAETYPTGREHKRLSGRASQTGKFRKGALNNMRPKKKMKRLRAKKDIRSSTLPVLDMKLKRELMMIQDRMAKYSSQQQSDGAYCIFHVLNSPKEAPKEEGDEGNNHDPRTDELIVGSSHYYSPNPVMTKAAPTSLIENVEEEEDEYFFSDTDDDSDDEVQIDPVVAKDAATRNRVLVCGRGPTVLGCLESTSDGSRICVLGDDCLSKSHLAIRAMRTRYKIKDLNSANGTYLQKTGDDVARQLHQDMIIMIGALCVKVTSMENVSVSASHDRTRHADIVSNDSPPIEAAALINFTPHTSALLQNDKLGGDSDAWETDGTETETDGTDNEDAEIDLKSREPVVVLSFDWENASGQRIVSKINTNTLNMEVSNNVVTIRVGADGITFGTAENCDVQLHEALHPKEHFMLVQIFTHHRRMFIRNVVDEFWHEEVQKQQRFWTKVPSSWQNLDTNDIIRCGRTYMRALVRFRQENDEDRHVKEWKEAMLDLNFDDGYYEKAENDSKHPPVTFTDMDTVSDPVLKPICEAGSALDPNFRFKAEMQDRCVVISDTCQTLELDLSDHSNRLRSFFAIFDGHQSRHVADFAASSFYQNLIDLLYPDVKLGGETRRGGKDPLLMSNYMAKLTRETSAPKSLQQGRVRSSSLTSTNAKELLSELKAYSTKLKGAEDDVESEHEGEESNESVVIEPNGVATENDEALPSKNPLFARFTSVSQDGFEAALKRAHLSVKDILNRSAVAIRKEVNSWGAASKSTVTEVDLPLSLAKSFERTSQQIVGLGDSAQYQGSTASVVILCEEDGKKVLHGANAGDSRVIVCQASTATQLSYDHTAADEGEVKRVGKTWNYRLGKNNRIIDGKLGHCLRVTRALGDRALLPFGLVDAPHTFSYELQPTDEFLCIASDGIWDVLSNEQVAILLQKNFTENQMDCDALAALVVSTAAEDKRCKDNLSCIVARIVL